MNTLETALAALRQHLIETWRLTPIAWQNVSFDPDRPAEGFAPGGPYITLSLVPGASRQASFGAPGSNLWRSEGSLRAEVFVPQGGGAKAALVLAETFAALFAGRRLHGLIFSGAELAAGGSEGGRWWRQSVSLSFRHEVLA